MYDIRERVFVDWSFFPLLSPFALFADFFVAMCYLLTWIHSGPFLAWPTSNIRINTSECGAEATAEDSAAA